MLFAIGYKHFSRFFIMDYQGNSKERFKNIFTGNIFMGLGISCLLSAIFVFQEGGLSWWLIPLSLCIGAFVIPIGILGAYWESFMASKLWGGFMPTVREKYGYAQAEIAKQNKIEPFEIKIPRRATITAILIALLVFFGFYVLLALIGWNGSPRWGLIFRLFASGLMAFGIYMTIISAAVSRRIQKLRGGKPLDDKDDD